MYNIYIGLQLMQAVFLNMLLLCIFKNKYLLVIFV